MKPIRCVIKDTGLIASPWSLDGLEGEIVWADFSAWTGYIVEVKLDCPPPWLAEKGKNVIRTYAYETEGRAENAVINELDWPELHRAAKAHHLPSISLEGE